MAASLTLLGKRCTIVMQEDVTLERGFGATAGGWFQRILEEHGVEVFGGESLDHFDGTGDRVTAVVTESGREIPADVVVIGAGAVPGHDARQGRRARAGGDGRGAVLVAARDLGARHLRGRATSASTTARSTAARSAWSTGTSRSARAGRSR